MERLSALHWPARVSLEREAGTSWSGVLCLKSWSRVDPSLRARASRAALACPAAIFSASRCAACSRASYTASVTCWLQAAPGRRGRVRFSEAGTLIPRFSQAPADGGSSSRSRGAHGQNRAAPKAVIASVARLRACPWLPGERTPGWGRGRITSSGRCPAVRRWSRCGSLRAPCNVGNASIRPALWTC